jgi:hypothetical protein
VSYFLLTSNFLGSWSEYAVCPERYIALKPASLSFENAASIPLAASTAFQALRKYDGDLSGKTVFVPAGCMLPFTLDSACLLAKKADSEWHWPFCLSIGQKCFPRRESDHYRFNSQGPQDTRTSRGGNRRPRYVLIIMESSISRKYTF